VCNLLLAVMSLLAIKYVYEKQTVRLFALIESPNLGVKMSWYVDIVVYFKFKKLTVFIIIRC